MKRLIIFCTLILGIQLADAQVRPFLRLDLGLLQQVRTRTQDFTTEGLGLGLYSGLAVNQTFEFQAGLRFAQREALREIETDGRIWNPGGGQTTTVRTIGLALETGIWMEVPLQVRYFFFEKHPFRLYAQAGGTWHKNVNRTFSQFPSGSARFLRASVNEFLSVNAAAGMQLSAGKKMDIFLDTGVENTALIQGFVIRSNAGIAFYPGR